MFEHERVIKATYIWAAGILQEYSTRYCAERHRGRVAYHNGDTNYYWYKTLWKVCFAPANAQQIAGARLLFNFDDERLVNFTVADFQTLQECFFELFGEQHTYYFDEIQNVKGWETFVRRLYNEGNKVIVTGSNARMLSRELGTHLTGRYIAVEIFPFPFKNTCSWQRCSWKPRTFI